MQIVLRSDIKHTDLTCQTSHSKRSQQEVRQA